jgi:hypothetical protein
LILVDLVSDKSGGIYSRYTLGNVPCVKDSLAVYCFILLIKKQFVWALTILSQGEHNICGLHWMRKVGSFFVYLVVFVVRG